MTVLLLALLVASYGLTFSIGVLYGLDNPDSFADWLKQYKSYFTKKLK